VCTGNTCRSPLAEALLREQARRRGIAVVVGSAGTYATEGAPAAEHSVRAARQRGADLGGHRARRLSAEMTAAADVVVAMSREHLAMVRPWAGPSTRTSVVTDFLPPDHPWRGKPIPDPLGGDWRAYEGVARLLEECVSAMLERIEEEG